MDKNEVSRKIAFLLRHAEGFTAKDGFVEIETLIDAVKKQYPSFSKELLCEIVETDRKKRYSFSSDGKKIRANQGHSTGVHIDFDVKVPPAVLYHGTAKRFLPSILSEGIKHMTRDYVHMTTDYQMAISSGRRYGSPVILCIDTAEMIKDGFVFEVSENNVWMIKYVPPQYFTVDIPKI